MAVAEPRAVASSLADYTVDTISPGEAAAVIMRYEWLRSMGGATLFLGLHAPSGELQGVSCFGPGPGGAVAPLLGGTALCLERGACVHYAPANAASYLISRACRKAAKITGIPRFYAYADPAAGEYGAVYQAAGWVYLGQGVQGERPMRAERNYVLAPGRDASDHTQWQTTRALRQGGRHLGFGAARALGWRIEKRAGKHVYANHVGAERQRWRAEIAARPYPAPHPERKRGDTRPSVVPPDAR